LSCCLCSSFRLKRYIHCIASLLRAIAGFPSTRIVYNYLRLFLLVARIRHFLIVTWISLKSLGLSLTINYSSTPCNSIKFARSSLRVILQALSPSKVVPNISIFSRSDFLIQQSTHCWRKRIFCGFSATNVPSHTISDLNILFELVN